MVNFVTLPWNIFSVGKKKAVWEKIPTFFMCSIIIP